MPNSKQHVLVDGKRCDFCLCEIDFGGGERLRKGWALIQAQWAMANASLPEVMVGGGPYILTYLLIPPTLLSNGGA